MDTDDIRFDRLGRMLYHPDFHPNHRKPFTDEELEYLCKYYEIDGRRAMSYALGKTEATLQTRVSEFKRDCLYDYYKNRNQFW